MFQSRKSLATATNASMRWLHLQCIQESARLLDDWRLKVKEDLWKHSQFVKTRRPRRQGAGHENPQQPKPDVKYRKKTTLFRFVMKNKRRTNDFLTASTPFVMRERLCYQERICAIRLWTTRRISMNHEPILAYTKRYLQQPNYLTL